MQGRLELLDSGSGSGGYGKTLTLVAPPVAGSRARESRRREGVLTHTMLTHTILTHTVLTACCVFHTTANLGLILATPLLDLAV